MYIRHRFVLLFTLLISPLPLMFAHEKSNFVVNKTYSADGHPHLIAVNEDTRHIYTTDVQAGTVTLFNADSGLRLATSNTGAGAHSVAVDQKRNIIYVSNRGADTLSVMDGETLEKINDIQVGKAPHGIDLNFKRKQIYVSNTGSHDVSVIDMQTHQLIKTIPAGMEPWGVTHHPEQPWIYTSNTGEGSISRIDINTGETLAKTTVGGRPWSIRINKRTNQVYATNESLAVLSVLKNDVLIAEIPVGLAPHGAAFVNEHLYAVAATGANQITLIDLDINKVAQTIMVDAGPTSLSYDSERKRIYVACQTAGTVNELKPIDD